MTNKIKLGDKVYVGVSRGTVVHLYTAEIGERRAFVRMEASGVKVQAAVQDLKAVQS